MADFDPRQLDMLEDALEQLEYVDDLAALELEPELSERLSEYKDVLALCRDAFPLEMPGETVLAEVIAEAREVSRRPRLRDAIDGDRSAWRSFWERWRGTLVPGFALAGTAAAMLWLLDPESFNRGELLTTPTHTQESDERRSEQAEPEPTKPASEQELHEPTPASEDTQPSAEPEPEAQDLAVPEKQPSSLPRAKQKKSAAVEPAVEPTPEPLNKDDAWTTLERADAARQRGNCDRARSLYDQVLAASPSAQTTARAKAGLGLCHEQDRRDGEATKLYEDARRGDPTIDTWIKQERDEQPPPGGKSKKSSMPAPVDRLEDSL